MLSLILLITYCKDRLPLLSPAGIDGILAPTLGRVGGTVTPSFCAVMGATGSTSLSRVRAFVDGATGSDLPSLVRRGALCKGCGPVCGAGIEAGLGCGDDLAIGVGAGIFPCVG